MKCATSILLAVLLLTAAYVFVWPSANLLYLGAIILHLLAGVAFLVALLFTLRGILRDRARLSQAGWVLLLLGGMLGAALIFKGTRRNEWPLLYAHIGVCVAGGAFLAASWAGRRGFLAGGAAAATGRAVVFLLAAAGIVAGAWWLRTVPWERAHRIVNPPISPATMDAEGDGAAGLYFPSSAQTAHGGRIPANYFMESQSCERCHADIYRQWQGSMHHFSSFNNAWYRKSIEYMQDVVGVKPSKWCAGCHDPALLFSGMFDRPVREIEDTPAARAGLGCMMCHSFSQVKSSMGQGDYTLEYPELHRLAASQNRWVRRLHDFVTELNPEPHRRVFLKPFMREQTAEFCSSCHKVHLDAPVNHYRWTRGFNEYDNWQASGVSGQGARSFYYPASAQQCADCHMPQVKSADAGNIGGFVHSHRFPAANTALPFVNDDTTQLSETEKFLTYKDVSVDIFAISPEAPEPKKAGGERGVGAPAAGAEVPGIQTTFAVGEEAETAVPAATGKSATPVEFLTAPLDRAGPTVRRSGQYRLDVVVRTRKLGHFFPGGTVDAFDCWLELKAVDDKMRVIFWSGGAQDDGKGPVDPGAHFYRSLQIDAHGNPINKRNAWATRATVYVHLIPPGAADTAHFRIVVPPGAGETIHVEARLNYRKFAWWNTQFSFTGVQGAGEPGTVAPGFDDRAVSFTGNPAQVPGGRNGIPALPIVVVAQNSVDLKVVPGTGAVPKPQVELNRDDWTRWNDYGIGLFLQGDLTGAAAAFQKITEIDPKNPDGWVNLGRVRVQEGNLTASREVLDRALAVSPHLARAHFFYARMLRSEGKYDEAAGHLREVLAQYPRDRVVHDDLGRIYFLERRYADAVREFEATLAIDPEDLEANYNLMLCYTGLGQPDRAGEFQKRYLRFKADEAAQTLTGPYRRSHPEDNLERQAIHEHVSAVSEKPAHKKYAAAMAHAKDSD
ncbi:MAG TPA: tetratricopeptide repeat protein [Candidatus Limnocylindrales bacterium]|nr:tetratricopeptide repeat protein [Candidatus Limnocylindrales bacterium]